MLRRSLRDRIFGRPIVNLPKPHHTIERLEFTEEERAFYDILEERFRDDINRLGYLCFNYIF